MELHSEESKQEEPLMVAEEIDLGDKLKMIEGVIVGETEKALLLKMGNEEKHWVPKSLIKSNYLSGEMIKQSFIIESWFFEKNKIAV